MLKELTEQIRDGVDLSIDQAAHAIDAMLDQQEESVTSEFLVALADKGETVSELTGAAQAIRARMQRVETTRDVVLDTCGTGGDHSGTFNISTAAALVTAASGVVVAKHGNRSITSKSGSADVLTRLGVNIQAPLEVVQRCLDHVGICFCFAPQLHPAVGNVAAIRKAIGRPTIFNWVGPLCNPADAAYQLLGVGKPQLRSSMAAALQTLGTTHGVVVCGRDGLDELTLADESLVHEVSPGSIVDHVWRPEDFGLTRAPLDALRVDGSADSAAMIESVLHGAKGPARDIVVLNAAAALWVTKVETDKQACRQKVEQAIDAGKARKLLEELSRLSHSD